MPLPVPASPVVVPAFTGVDAQDRGNKFVHTPTKSVLDYGSAFTSENVCGVADYINLNGSINVNDFTDDCQIVNQGSASIKLRIPADGTDADIDALLAPVIAQIKIMRTVA